jgi:hypothetical protein
MKQHKRANAKRPDLGCPIYRLLMRLSKSKITPLIRVGPLNRPPQFLMYHYPSSSARIDDLRALDPHRLQLLKHYYPELQRPYRRHVPSQEEA